MTGEGLENINFNKLITLNSSAAFLWQEVVGKEFTAEEMAQLLINRYGIDKELAIKDAVNLCNALTDAGVAE